MSIRSIQIDGFNNGTIGSIDAVSLSKCFNAYADIVEPIEAIGYNSHSGYAYIYLDNSIAICSRFGNAVEYLVTDFETGEEVFFDDYDDAVEYLNGENENE